MSDLIRILEETAQSYDPVSFDDSHDRQAAEHIVECINERMDRLEERQNVSDRTSRLTLLVGFLAAFGSILAAAISLLQWLS